MNNCLYGKLNSETIIKKYSYKNTDGTLKLNIDNKNNEISGQVLKTIGSLKFRKSGKIIQNESATEDLYFNGSKNVIVDIPETDFKGSSSNDTAIVTVDNTTNIVDVQVTKTPGVLKITRGVEGEEKVTLVEYDGSENKEINLDEIDTYSGDNTDTANTYVDPISNKIKVDAKGLLTKDGYITGNQVSTGLTKTTYIEVVEPEMPAESLNSNFGGQLFNVSSGNQYTVDYLRLTDENAFLTWFNNFRLGYTRSATDTRLPYQVQVFFTTSIIFLNMNPRYKNTGSSITTEGQTRISQGSITSNLNTLRDTYGISLYNEEGVRYTNTLPNTQSSWKIVIKE